MNATESNAIRATARTCGDMRQNTNASNLLSTEGREMSSNIEIKLQRLAHANDLIKIIAAHGRRFFFSEHTGRTAEIFIGPRGRVWFVDEYTGKIIYTHKTTWANKWRGFSHGGTLRSLVEMMRDYIVTGRPIPAFYLGPERNKLTNGNIWGYEPAAMQAVRDAACKLPIIDEVLQ